MFKHVQKSSGQGIVRGGLVLCMPSKQRFAFRHESECSERKGRTCTRVAATMATHMAAAVDVASQKERTSCSRIVSGQGALCRACLDAGGVRQCRQRPAAVRQAAYPACSRSAPQSWLRFVRPSSNRLADKNLDVPVGDERRNEVPPLVARFPASAVDAFIASPLTHPPPRRCRSRLRPCLCHTFFFPELARIKRSLLALRSGWFGVAAVQLLRLLARPTTVPAASRPAAITAWVARWSGLLAIAAKRAYAASGCGAPISKNNVGATIRDGIEDFSS